MNISAEGDAMSPATLLPGVQHNFVQVRGMGLLHALIEREVGFPLGGGETFCAYFLDDLHRARHSVLPGRAKTRPVAPFEAGVFVKGVL